MSQWQQAFVCMNLNDKEPCNFSGNQLTVCVNAFRAGFP